MGEEVHGDEAIKRWRELRTTFCAIAVTLVAYLVGAWLWWEATGDEVAAAVAGLTLISWGSLLWRHGILGFSYSSETADGETTRSFKSMESPVSPRVAVPVLMLAGFVLLLPSLPVPGADRFRPVTSVVLTAKDAGTNAAQVPGIILGWVLAPLILLIFVVFGVAMVLAPFWQLLKAATGRGDSEGVDWVTLPMGLALLGVVGLAVWAGMMQWDQAWADYFRPFKEVGDWFR
jgi:hypothetical protein